MQPAETIINKRITAFIEKNTCLSLATCENNTPYSASCFYAFMPEINSLAIKSKESTTHIRQALNNKLVSGTIHPDKLQLAKIQGIQFSGELINSDLNIKRATSAYYDKYPFARAIPGKIWIIQLSDIKMTDNTLGFSEKLKWNNHGEL